MKRMASKKSHSWWWDSHISRKNSKWLEENLEEMDRSVKEMLKLIEEEGDSFAKKAEMYYQKRPELISRVEDFYRRYRALAERYDQVTGDLRKNIRSELKSQGSYSGSDLVSDPPSPSSVHSPEQTPESKHRPKLSSRAAGFNVFLGAGDSPDRSRKSSDDSSSSSESESDVDDSDNVNSDHTSSRLHQRILELQDELREANEKLKEQEEKFYLEHSRHMENGHKLDHSSELVALEGELSVANKKLHDSEAEIFNLQKKLEEQNACLETKNAELDMEKKKVSELDEQMAMLRGTILTHELEIKQLNEKAIVTGKQFETDLVHCNSQIEELKNELVKSNEKLSLEKSCLESENLELKVVQTRLETEVDKILQEKLSLETQLLDLKHVIQDVKASSASTTEKLLKEKSALEDEVANLSESIKLLESKVESSHNEVLQLEVQRTNESEENRKQIDELNQNLDALKVQIDTLTAEKHELSAKMDQLMNDVECRDDKICQMDQHLHHLHLEHAKLIIETDAAKRTSAELSERVQELEDVIDKQKVAISDGAEGKKEAIRQLCFSLEHYRDGYHQLRQLLQGHKRPAVAAA